ncbi:alpha/beta fold hydrolase [Pacificoceanicola onchidii]|uniref:alpha/beta fold hydrolase n=1 Tax=Pacificoceanicola onchidii TaxID=2562685 RepID=UPI0010A2DAAA|nr:alpha/beta hydrolase [Pacificoceanicola onchidii]
MAGTPQDCTFDVDGLRYAGLAWGPEDGVPVLALHGWMDHAESFAELAPRLTGCRVVALDLSGQGQSGHRAAHATYNLWDDLPQLVAILDALGWERAVLLGHSRGANIAALMAAAVPERVRGLIALDSLVPEPVEADFVSTLSAFVKDTRKALGRGARRFESVETYAARRQAQGNAEAVAAALATRALRTVDGGVEMTADNRMFASSAAKLRAEDVDAVLRAIRCPVLNVWASEGIISRPKLAEAAKKAPELIADYRSESVAGDHHFHMEPRAAEKIAELVAEFARRV